MTTDDSCKQQDFAGGRDSRGRFRKGSSGNRKGRPKGSASRGLIMARDAVDRILPQVIEAAEAGDMDAARLVLSYGLPRLRPCSVPETLPETPEGILSAMSAGVISAEVAGDALAAHMSAAKIRELGELAARVDALAAAVERLTGGKV